MLCHKSLLSLLKIEAQRKSMMYWHGVWIKRFCYRLLYPSVWYIVQSFDRTKPWWRFCSTTIKRIFFGMFRSPVGLLHMDESVEKVAWRELQEEMGFTRNFHPTIPYIQGSGSGSAWTCDYHCLLCHGSFVWSHRRRWCCRCRRVFLEWSSIVGFRIWSNIETDFANVRTSDTC